MDDNFTQQEWATHDGRSWGFIVIQLYVTALSATQRQAGCMHNILDLREAFLFTSDLNKSPRYLTVSMG